MGPKRFSLILGLILLWLPVGGQCEGLAEGITAFVNVNLVPMTAEIVIPGQTVLVEDGTIAAVGPSNTIEIPTHAQIIQGSNSYLLPGLADMHIHTEAGWLNGGWPISPLDLFLVNGVTTIRDFGPRGVPRDYALFWRKEIEKGRFRGPWIYAAGPILYGPVDQAAQVVGNQDAQGFDFIKLYSFLSQREFREALEAAKQLDIYTAGHIPFAVGLDGVLSAGMDEIAHIEELDFEFLNFDRSRTLGHAEWFRYILRVASEQMAPLSDLSSEELKSFYQKDLDKIIAKLKASQTPVCTTLSVDQVVVKKLFHTDELIASPTSPYLAHGVVDSLKQGTNRHQVQFHGYEDVAPVHFKLNQLLLRELHTAGVHLVLGTDAGRTGMGLAPGYSLHDELSILVENGFTPYGAIRTATVNAADVVRRMNGKGDFGTIEEGKRADLLLVADNPLDDINNLKKLQGVMAAGRWFDETVLQSMLSPQIPITTTVKHVYDPNQTHHTYFDIVIDSRFGGKLPGAIDGITVTGPNGELPIQKEDLTYLPKLRDFWIKIPGKPKIGIYRVDVTSGEQQGSAWDIQATIKTLPFIDVQKIAPLDGALLNPDSPTFSWQPVKNTGDLYYRLEVNAINGGRVYATGYMKNMHTHTLPREVLKSDRTYRWRVRTTDGNHWKRVQNRSHCAWQVFHCQ